MFDDFDLETNKSKSPAAPNELSRTNVASTGETFKNHSNLKRAYLHFLVREISH